MHKRHHDRRTLSFGRRFARHLPVAVHPSTDFTTHPLRQKQALCGCPSSSGHPGQSGARLVTTHPNRTWEVAMYEPSGALFRAALLPVVANLFCLDLPQDIVMSLAVDDVLQVDLAILIL